MKHKKTEEIWSEWLEETEGDTDSVTEDTDVSTDGKSGGGTNYGSKMD